MEKQEEYYFDFSQKLNKFDDILAKMFSFSYSPYKAYILCRRKLLKKEIIQGRLISMLYLSSQICIFLIITKAFLERAI